MAVEGENKVEKITEIINSMPETTLSFMAILVGTIATYISKAKVDERLLKHEQKEVEEALSKYNFTIVDGENKKEKKKVGEEKDFNILKMMYDNVGELKEYYVISKQQARRAFSAALLASIFGFVIYIIGIVATAVLKTNVSIISIIGGTTAEFIASLFFWLYRESMKQLSIYHQRLSSTEKYLTVIQIIKELPEDKRAESYQNLTIEILKDNREIISREK